jgi:transcriptional regulator with XRE-family HTH domain
MTDELNLAFQELERRVNAAGSRSAVAEELNIAPSQLSDVLNGRREISQGMLKKLGFDKVVISVRKQDKAKLIRAIRPAVVTFGQPERHVEG